MAQETSKEDNSDEYLIYRVFKFDRKENRRALKFIKHLLQTMNLDGSMENVFTVMS